MLLPYRFRRLVFSLVLSLVILPLFPADGSALQQIETEYFTIIYDDGGEYTAGRIARFCDDIYEKLMARYDAFSDDPRVVCIVNDSVDLANGYAQYYQNTITIYATNMDYELRGQSSWLENVFVHEMTHMIALKKAANGPLNFIAFGGARYDRNPDLLVDMAWYHLSQPAWFSEGVAQTGAQSYGAERWDSHRDMILRAAWYEDGLLDYGNMSVLSGQKSIEAELVYNQGYSMVTYIRETYGYDTVVALNNAGTLFDFDATLEEMLGIDSVRLYEDWRGWLDGRYAEYSEREYVTGELVENRGSTDYYPAVSPDGRYLAWLSNRGKDYTVMDLMLKDLSTGEVSCLVEEVDYRVSWSHDSSTLVYVKRPDLRPNYYDIYTYDIATETERRISKHLRARDPSYSPGDSLIVFVQNGEGNNTLAVMRADGTGLRYLSSTHNGMQFYKPSFTPDGDNIVFGVYKQGLDRDIAMIEAGGETYRYSWTRDDSTSAFSDSLSFAKQREFTLLLGTDNDERDPVLLGDGSGFLYSSDAGGIFNIWRYDFGRGTTTRMTDVLGGAFTPAVSGDGAAYYAGYSNRGFSLYALPMDTGLATRQLALLDRDYLTQPERFDIAKHFSPSPVSRRRILQAVMPTVSLGPSFIGSDFGLRVLDVGVQAYISDLLDQDMLVVSGSIGKNFDDDVSLNNRLEFYYERKMVPITSSKFNHSPTMYVGGYRSVIHNNIKQLEGRADSVYFDDRPDLGYANVLHDLHQNIRINDLYKHEFRTLRSGVHVPLAPNHALVFELGYRQYLETLNRHHTIRDMSTFVFDGTDITGEVPDARTTTNQGIRYFTNLEYYRSGELSLSYSYSKSADAADNDISPKGTSAYLRFRHMRTTIADSLVNQPAWWIPVGMTMDGSFNFQSYHPDPTADELRPFKKDDNINEYLGLFQHNREVPFLDHVIGGAVLGAYKDVQLKDAARGEGAGFNWPLKYYLGGADMLSGYPYFSFWGSKLFYSRFEYTVPLRKYMGKRFFGINLQHVYASLFGEAAKVWNFRRMSMDNLREGDFKRDVGVELRLKTIWFYRLPAYVTARVAWPLDDMSGSPYHEDRDPRRFYFMIRM